MNSQYCGFVVSYCGKQKEFGCQAKNQSSEDALGFFLVVKINTMYSYSDGEEEEEQDTCRTAKIIME